MLGEVSCGSRRWSGCHRRAMRLPQPTGDVRVLSHTGNVFQCWPVAIMLCRPSHKQPYPAEAGDGAGRGRGVDKGVTTVGVSGGYKSRDIERSLSSNAQPQESVGVGRKSSWRDAMTVSSSPTIHKTRREGVGRHRISGRKALTLGSCRASPPTPMAMTEPHLWTLRRVSLQLNKDPDSAHAMPILQRDGRDPNH